MKLNEESKQAIVASASTARSHLRARNLRVRREQSRCARARRGWSSAVSQVGSLVYVGYFGCFNSWFLPRGYFGRLIRGQTFDGIVHESLKRPRHSKYHSTLYVQ